MTTKALFNTTLAGVFVVTLGCGMNIFEGMTDDETPAAKEEAARIALDNGDYDDAVALLESLCGTDPDNLTCGADTQQDLASSYIGQATGLDVIQLINKAEEIGTSTAENTYTNLSTLFPLEDIQTCADNPSQLCSIQDDMDKAIAILENLLPDTVPADPTSEEKDLYLQLAVAAATDVVVTVGILSGGLDDQGVPNAIPADLPDPTRLVDDINNVADGVQGSGLGGEDLAQSVDDVRTELDGNGDGDVDLSELQCYVQKIQGGTCP